MQRNASTGIPPALVWTLGLLLLAVVAATSQDWRDAWSAIGSGKAPTSLTTPTTFQGLWRIGGGLLLVWLLALLTSVSETGGVFAVTFLLICWVFWLVQHGQPVANLLGKFTQAG